MRGYCVCVGCRGLRHDLFIWDVSSKRGVVLAVWTPGGWSDLEFAASWLDVDIHRKLRGLPAGLVHG